MRNLRNPQLERGEVRIEDIELDIKSRDDIPVLLIGLQHLYTQEALRDRLFALMDEHFLPGINRKVGRPGMAMWSILVMAVVKQGLGCDFDRLHELANQHKTLRNFFGHTDSDKKRYHYQTLVDNVSLLTPELLGKVNLLIVQRFPIKFKLSGPAANLGARHGPAGIVRFGGTAVLFRRLLGR